MNSSLQISDQTGRVQNRSARWALAALALAMLLSSMGTSIANVALPTLADAFGASFQQAQWIVLSYLLAVTTVIVSVGRLGDIIGRRRLLLIGVALFTLASGLCGLAPSLWLLLAARGVQGLGAAIMMALSVAFVADTVPKQMLGSAMGLLGTMSAVGTALGPSLGGFLIAGPGWRAIFFINIPLGLLALLLAGHALPPDRRHVEKPAEHFDIAGTLLLALALASFALAMTVGRGDFGYLNAVLVFSAFFSMALFAWIETKAASPLIRLALLRKPGLIPMFNDNDPWRGTGDGRPGRSIPQSAAKAAVEDCDTPSARHPAHPKGRAHLPAGVVENPQWTYGSISGLLLASRQIRSGAMGHYH